MNTKNYVSQTRQAKTIAFPRKHFKSPEDVISSVIRELRKASIKIHRVSFFEDPLEAIVQIDKLKPKNKTSILLKLLGIRQKSQKSRQHLKLYVLKNSNKQSPFQLKYEFVTPPK